MSASVEPGVDPQESAPPVQAGSSDGGGAKSTPVANATPLPSPPPAEDPPEEGAPAWMMTFGDMMSLLLTFFILLFSMSEIKVEKFRLAAASIREGFGDSMGELMPGQPPPGAADIDVPLSLPGEGEAERLVDQELDSIAARLNKFVEDNDLGDDIVVTRDESGVYLRIQDAAVFASGAAGIQAQGLAIIEQLGAIVLATDVPVVVSGHTDDRPIRAGGKYDSNWELSAARAAGVARALVDRGYDPADVTVEAYGEYRPIDTNESEDGRARNRRVEIFYSRQKVEEKVRQFRDGNGEADGQTPDSTALDPGN